MLNAKLVFLFNKLCIIEAEGLETGEVSMGRAASPCSLAERIYHLWRG